jgi:hypothetical protein
MPSLRGLRGPLWLLACVCVLPGVGATAFAAPRHSSPVDAEVERLEIAREHFQRGEELVAAGSLEAALVEYELAEVAHPSPSTTEAKQRVRALIEARHAPPAVGQLAPLAPAQGATRPLHRFVAPIVVAPIALGALVSGAVLLGVTQKDIDHLRATCSPACNPSDVSPLKSRQAAAAALLAVGGALVAADVVLWAVLARKYEAPRLLSFRPQLAVGPNGGSLTIAGRF